MPAVIVSSLYRCEQHLPAYTAAVYGFAKQVHESGVDVQYLPIVNDASARERDAIERLSQEINGAYFGRMTPIFVPRESLYASWNRGLGSSDADVFASWNADDLRSAGAFAAGYAALQRDADLVDFPFMRVGEGRRFGFLSRQNPQHVAALYQPERFDRGTGIGPFFMARRKLLHRVGGFDENFRVAGDMEWAGRAQAVARFRSMEMSGGDFVIHGGNLSNTGGDREDIEVNIIFMRRGDWTQLVPAHPRAQLDAWNSWGNFDGRALSPAVANFLWGADAHDRWLRYKRERASGKWRRRIRLALAARGIIHSEEWALHLRSLDMRE